MKKILFAVSALCWLSVSAQYNSLLWKITGNGLKEPSYLYGTMHTADKRVVKMSDASMKYFKTTRAFAMELDPKESFNMGLLAKLMMGKGHSLKEMLPAREYALLDSMVKEQVGYSLKLFDNVAPVFIMTILQSAGVSAGDSTNEGDEVLDLYFHRLAKEGKKKVIGIETVDEQLSALNVLTYQEQADMLVHEIREYEKNDNAMKDMVRFYLDQNLDSIALQNDEDPMPEKFYKALVTDRNKRMANRIDEFIAKQPTFIAVGALHLPGEKGVIELLRKKGFVVESVK